MVVFVHGREFGLLVVVTSVIVIGVVMGGMVMTSVLVFGMIMGRMVMPCVIVLGMVVRVVGRFVR